MNHLFCQWFVMTWKILAYDSRVDAWGSVECRRVYRELWLLAGSHSDNPRDWPTIADILERANRGADQ